MTDSRIVRDVAGLGILAAAALALAGCTSAAPSTELTVYAAASLSGAFDEIAAEFSAAHPDITVNPISYDGSSVLATQIIGGAPADVFAAADEASMATVTDAGLADHPVSFAANELQIATAPGNPLGLTDLASLTDVTTVLCIPEAPCGRASATLLQNAGVTLTAASEEQNVTAVLTKVTSGEADAGLVYVTDVLAAGADVTGIPIDGADAATNVYPIAALNDSEAAEAFLSFVTGPSGQAVLADYGFEAP